MHCPVICRGTEAVPAMPRQDYGMYFCQNQNARGIYAKSGSTSMHWPEICCGAVAVPAMFWLDHGMYSASP
jgi:hypothetical protein